MRSASRFAYVIFRGVFAGATLALLPIAAQAAEPTPQSSRAPDSAYVCDAPVTWSITNKTTDAYIPGKPRVYGDPGMTIGIDKGESVTWTGGVTGGVTAEAGVIFAKASASFSTTISRAKQGTVTVSARYTVPKGVRGGFIEAGAHGIGFTYKKTYWVSPCTKKTATGTGKGVTRSSYVWFHKGTFL